MEPTYNTIENPALKESTEDNHNHLFVHSKDLLIVTPATTNNTRPIIPNNIDMFHHPSVCFA